MTVDARLLASIADTSARHLDEVRLPLHILLDNHFGELNENQEEMLAAARTAADAADADMLALRELAELELGERPLRQDRVKPSALIDAIRPMLLAIADSAGATLEISIAPLLPAVVGDRARLQDALVTLFRAVIEPAKPESRLGLEADRTGGTIRFVLHGGGSPPASVRWAAAAAVVSVHGGRVDQHEGTLELELPIEGRAPAAHHQLAATPDERSLSDRFLERLASVALPAWFEVCAATPEEVAQDGAVALTRALSESADPFAVWRLRDDVDTVLFRFESAEGRLLLRGRVKLSHVRLVTERAARALLVRSALSAAVFDALYGPFSPVIPVGSL